MSVMAVLSVSAVTADMLLSFLFVSGALANCQSSLFVTAPKRMEALSGSCLHIPCNFSTKTGEELNSTRPISGVWVINPRTFGSDVIFNSSSAVNRYPLSLTGNLRQNDCTTLFSNLTRSYTNTYFFKIENQPFRASAFCDPLQITVRDSPPSPTIQISGDLTEKESVTVTCSAFTPCPHSPPQLTWNLQQDAPNKIEENTDGTFTAKIQKTITLSDRHDGYKIICSVRYPVNGRNGVRAAAERKTLNVSYSPRDTSVVISPTDPVSVGSVVNLTCSCRGNPPARHFVWFTINDGRLELIGVHTQVYGFSVSDSDRGTLFYCGCRNYVDIQLSTGRPLIFRGYHPSELVSVAVIVKTVGIVMLVSMFVIFECWFLSRRSTKPVKEPEETDYVNTVAELPS